MSAAIKNGYLLPLRGFEGSAPLGRKPGAQVVTGHAAKLGGFSGHLLLVEEVTTIKRGNYSI